MNYKRLGMVVLVLGTTALYTRVVFWAVAALLPFIILALIGGRAYHRNTRDIRRWRRYR